VICLQDMAHSIINNKWYSKRQSNVVDESHRIIVAAAKLIKAEIREKSYTNKEYPVSTDFNNELH